MLHLSINPHRQDLQNLRKMVVQSLQAAKGAPILSNFSNFLD
jgi:hypothetical protein